VEVCPFPPLACHFFRGGTFLARFPHRVTKLPPGPLNPPFISLLLLTLLFSEKSHFPYDPMFSSQIGFISPWLWDPPSTQYMDSRLPPIFPPPRCHLPFSGRRRHPFSLAIFLPYSRHRHSVPPHPYFRHGCNIELLSLPLLVFLPS